MKKYFIIPGLGNSGPQHWQTWFESKLDNCSRIQQKEWDAPTCSDWISTIDEALKTEDLSTVVLIAHSLGCTTVAHWAKQYNKKIRGALLVAPSDIENPVYTFPATGFSPVPLNKINFPTIVVASDDDHWVSKERAAFFAHAWGSELISIGDAGHINADAGYGEWPAGLDILQHL